MECPENTGDKQSYDVPSVNVEWLEYPKSKTDNSATLTPIDDIYAIENEL